MVFLLENSDWSTPILQDGRYHTTHRSYAKL